MLRRIFDSKTENSVDRPGCHNGNKKIHLQTSPQTRLRPSHKLTAVEATSDGRGFGSANEKLRGLW